ncbi:MAG: sigma 54-dependent Fis family transcriptional regulator [Myxococcota bacterium]
MMQEDETQEHGRGKTSAAVRAIAVEVIDGPDRGLRFTSKEPRLTIGTATNADVVLTDPTVSRYHVELGDGRGAISLHDLGSKNGTYAGAIRVSEGTIPSGTTLKVGRTTLRVEDAGATEVELLEAASLAGIVGASESIRRLMAQVERAAKFNSAALVTGESGTGKELVSEALHLLSPRKQGPWVVVDCASISPTLVGSELFGHERGAFTGADRRHIGAFERAHKGTLLLDEIGELPPAMQQSLLGVLERRRFRRVGGSEEVEVDVRVVAATNRDLRGEVNRGSFRLDLYYRLAVVQLVVPPLRDRLEDLPVLIGHFLREAGYEGPIEDVTPPDVLEALSRHAWPGNVRELKNVIGATLAMGAPPELGELDQPGLGSAPRAPGEDPVPASFSLPYRQARTKVLDDFEARYVRHLLDKSAGNVTRASREGQIDRSYLTELIRKHGVKKDRR